MYPTYGTRHMLGRSKGSEAVALLVGPGFGDGQALADALAAHEDIPVAVCATARQALASLTPTVRIAAVSLDLAGDGAEGLIRELRKRSPHIEIVALAGETKLRPLATYIADALREIGRPAPAGISEREAQVLRLLTRGETYGAIAQRLGISLGTVQSHIKALYRKLDVRNKAEAAAKAVRIGLL